MDEGRTLLIDQGECQTEVSRSLVYPSLIVESFCRLPVDRNELLTTNLGSSRNNDPICNLQESANILGSSSATCPYWYVRDSPLDPLQPLQRFRFVSSRNHKPVCLPEPDSLVGCLFQCHTGQRYA